MTPTRLPLPFDGYKTYIVATLVGILSASYYLEWIDVKLYTTLLGLLGAGALYTVRDAITKIQNKRYF